MYTVIFFIYFQGFICFRINYGYIQIMLIFQLIFELKKHVLQILQILQHFNIGIWQFCLSFHCG